MLMANPRVNTGRLRATLGVTHWTQLKGFCMSTDTYNLCNLVLQALVWFAMIATFLVYRGQLRAMRDAATGQNILSLVNFLQTNEVREARRIVRENLRQKTYSEWSAAEKLAASMVCSNYDVAAILIFQQSNQRGQGRIKLCVRHQRGFALQY